MNEKLLIIMSEEAKLSQRIDEMKRERVKEVDECIFLEVEPGEKSQC